LVLSVDTSGTCVPVWLRQLLIEPKGTPNTGDAGGPLTAVEQEI
jgi:hypothetical protein